MTPFRVDTAARLEDALAIRTLVTRLIRASNKSRDQIAGEMSQLVGWTVTKRALDSYTSEAEQQNRWPAQLDIAFCLVIDDWSLLEERVHRAGFQMIGADELPLLELGRQHVIEKRAAAAIARLERELAEVAL